MSAQWDDTLLQDFLAEAGELIEQLDADLVKLENAADAAASTELLNSIFRALHTVKGAAGFLGVDSVTSFAHVAEDALNHLRKGAVQVDAAIIDTLLRSVDVLRGMIGQMEAGDTVQPCPGDLMAALAAVASGNADITAAPDEGNSPADAANNDASGNASSDAGEGATAAPTAEARTRPLSLPSQKEDLLGFMTVDLRESTAQIRDCLEQAKQRHERGEAATHLTELTEGLSKTADFFELAELHGLVELVSRSAAALADLPESASVELLTQLRKVCDHVDEQANWLEQGQVLVDSTQAMESDVERLLTAEHAAEDASPAPATADNPDATPTPDATADDAASTTNAGTAAERRAPEKTIRVELGRLESLLNLVGQLVLAKNRMLGIGRKLHDHDLPQELNEEISSAANDLDRVTASLQMGVMRTRMQPLAKLFDRYPRVIRDIARATDKQIQLEIAGEDTEVDKGVLELLADPLVHILRNSADHGVEAPSVRLDAGKAEMGTIRLLAEHQGSHVRLAIEDDGKGIDRQVIASKAVEKGLATTEQVETMSDEEVFRFIFAAGFSTAEKVSDLSGRGVGMDVVQTNVNKMNGTINVRSEAGRGTSIEILIPLTVAIMPAMAVEVGKHLYCVPLQNISEIVRPDPAQVSTVHGKPVMRLRESVLPLLDLRQSLDEPCDRPPRFAVVIQVGNAHTGLLVDRLIGQQDIVIKPLDDSHVKGGPFSGATIQDDGRVSLILDVDQLLRHAQTPEASALAARQVA